MVVNKVMFAALAVARLAGAAVQYGSNHSSPSPPRPNFIFIMTDDQDLHLNSLDYMPAVRRHFTEQGTTFDRHYTTVSLCCPARVTLFTGRAAHNTNVTNIVPPYGGYEQFVAEGWHENYLPIWLQAENYNTYIAGKLMNGFRTTNYDDPRPKGWTSHDVFLDPKTYSYYNATMQKDDEPPRSYEGHYSTDLVSEKSIRFLDEAIHDRDHKPFFLVVTPIGPHSEEMDHKGDFDAPLPAHRHKDWYPDLKAPRTSNFNPDVPSGGGWIKTLDRLNDTVVDYFDNWYRQRILALQAVDDLVNDMMRHLEKNQDVLDNTYLIYTSDNGYHIGQHRLPPGKTCYIEEDVNVPFIIRGPGVEKGKTVSVPTTHTDLAPTLFQLAGIPLQDEFDGEPMPVTSEQLKVHPGKIEHINVEYWGTGIPEGKYKGDGSQMIDGRGINNTYKAIRVINDEYSLSYVVWCSNEHELYDMKVDVGQMHNIYGTNSTINGWVLPQLETRIDALLLTLKACKGVVCTRPWETLHPQGDVHSLRDAMDPKFDVFYANELKVTYTECMLGYLPQYEGALSPIPYSTNASKEVRWWKDDVQYKG